MIAKSSPAIRRMADRARYCNCARCGAELLGKRNPPHLLETLARAGYEVVEGHVEERPYCRFCLLVVRGR